MEGELKKKGLELKEVDGLLINWKHVELVELQRR
jgi:hypothetical protein